jgi:hypothetical protein
MVPAGSAIDLVQSVDAWADTPIKEAQPMIVACAGTHVAKPFCAVPSWANFLKRPGVNVQPVHNAVLLPFGINLGILGGSGNFEMWVEIVLTLFIPWCTVTTRFFDIDDAAADSEAQARDAAMRAFQNIAQSTDDVLVPWTKANVMSLQADFAGNMSFEPRIQWDFDAQLSPAVGIHRICCAAECLSDPDLAHQLQTSAAEGVEIMIVTTKVLAKQPYLQTDAFEACELAFATKLQVRNLDLAQRLVLVNPTVDVDSQTAAGFGIPIVRSSTSTANDQDPLDEFKAIKFLQSKIGTGWSAFLTNPIMLPFDPDVIPRNFMYLFALRYALENEAMTSWYSPFLRQQSLWLWALAFVLQSIGLGRFGALCPAESKPA